MHKTRKKLANAKKDEARIAEESREARADQNRNPSRDSRTRRDRKGASRIRQEEG